MRGLTGRAPRDGTIQRRGTLVPTLVLLLLAIMIVRDIVVRRWTGTPTAPPDVTRSR
jgi:hypothetical protein